MVTIALTFSLVGALILSRRKDNGLGWLFAVNGPVVVVSGLVRVLGYRGLVGDLGFETGRSATWAADMSDPLVVALMTVFLYLLFPEGRLRSHGERRTALVAAVGVLLATMGAFLEPHLQEYPDVGTPFALAIPAAVSWTLVGTGYAVIIGTVVSSIVLLIRRLRRARGRERDQLRLLVWATVVATILIVPPIFSPPGASWTRVMYLLGGLGFLLIPVSVGVAILRHRLLDIDLVIRRTVVVAVLGAFITVVYVGMVVGVGAMIGRSGNVVLSAVAAAVVALAFQPLRRWAQQLSNRVVYGERATPYEVLHEFSERVAGSYGTEDVLPRMAAILGEGTGASRAQVWMLFGSELRPVAVWPSGVRPSDAAWAPGPELPPMPDVSLAVPVRDDEELLGALSVTKDASDPVTQTEERLVGDLAHQAGLVLRNVRLVEDLRASRTRLVAAQDEERRKLERDIHDGAQQHLVALTVKAQLADSMVDRDAAKARQLLAEIKAETTEALEALRDLARGIYPPLLADKGLAAALEAQARKVTVPTEVNADGAGRYPEQVEATVYFCCLEALQNTAKYADASRATVSISASEGALTFQVSDDGRGFDPASTPRGSGLQNMSDRLEAVGGALEIRSAPGGGTTLTGRVPLHA
ncbi:MAG TPA: GAF domain-containing sensor histidine kinase [Actinomycetota bacterium]